MAKADRLKRLPPYLFAEIDKKKKAAVAAGRPIIDLGVGDPDKPTPRFVIEAMQAAVEDPSTHRYALDRGDPAFRNSIAAWFRERFGVALDPETEILPTMGSKDAISHIPLAVMNPGDVCLCPDPGYPVYRAATNFAEGEVASMPLLAENDFLPDLDAIDPDTRRRATLMYINYPNNPTGATAPLEFYEKVVAFCVENSIVLVQDAAYNELYFDEPPPSIFQIDGAKEVAIEFHSLSKTFNMTGWRIGWAAGGKDVIDALGQLKSYMDNGLFTAAQRAGIAAVEGYNRPEILQLRKMYHERRDALVDGLEEAGLKVCRPKATFHVWIHCPEGKTSTEFAAILLEDADIVATPGVGLGPHGEGYVRMCLTVDTERLREAAERVKKLKL